LSFCEQARHSPRLQVPEQAVVVVQRPAWHSRTLLPRHCLGSPGAHSPPHALVAGSQTNVQDVGGPQLPFASHVSTVVDPAAQRVSPGRHEPEHSPAPPQT